MPEDSDYTRAPWSASDSFASTRAAYDSHVGRSYADAKSKKVAASDLVPDRLSTNAEQPVFIITDETGSMGKWTSIIFSKLGYLAHEAKFYRGEDCEIAFGAFGDANPRGSEDYPVQVRPFAKDAALQDRLKELVIEGNGGGQMSESSELLALYAARNMDTPNAKRPLVIFITDEKCYPTIYPEDAQRLCKVDLKANISTKEIFEELKAKCSVYLVRKPYGSIAGDDEDSCNAEIRKHWEQLLGADHIAFLADPDRVVDVIFGIFAQEANMIAEFTKELKERQLPDKGGMKKVETVMKALQTIHTATPETVKKLPGDKSVKKLPGSKASDSQSSVTRRDASDKTSRRTKPLLDE